MRYCTGLNVYTRSMKAAREKRRRSSNPILKFQ
uniref:Uncharacterized protein n=1 Tax=Oryza punctata TaxID=4537 RepID=A0A0E0LJA3_ORYPU